MSSPRTSQHRNRLLVLLALPVVGLLVWYAVEQVWLASRSPTPRWSITLAEQAGSAPCDSVIGAGLPDAIKLPADTPTWVSPTLAALVIDQVQRSYRAGDATLSQEESATPFSSPLRLIRATFPDGTQHNAWGQVISVKEHDGGFAADAVLIYVDATTGEALLSVDNILLSDPYMMCGSTTPLLLHGIFWQLVAPGLVMLYLLCLGILLLIWVIWKRARKVRHT